MYVRVRVCVLELERLRYNALKDTMMKVNDRYEYPLVLELESFLDPAAR